MLKASEREFNVESTRSRMHPRITPMKDVGVLSGGGNMQRMGIRNGPLATVHNSK